MSKEQGQPKKRGDEFRKNEREQEMSPVFLSAAGWVRPLFPHWRCRSQRHSKINYWAHKVTCWFWKRTEGPHKTASRCRLHILSGFFIFNIFFSSIIQPASLIDMTAVRVISVPDIWSVLALGVGGAWVGIVFSSFMMAGVSDQLLPTSLFYHRGGFETSLCCPFFIFSGAEANLLQSQNSLFRMPRKKKKDLWVRKALFKMSL